MFPWMNEAQASLSVRPARPEDIYDIEQLLQSSSRTHIHTDWRSPMDWIGRAPALVAENRYGLAGCLVTPADPTPAAWIRLAAVAHGAPPAAVMRPLLEAALAALADQAATSLAAMPVKPWLPAILDDMGFAIVEQVSTWEKPDLSIPHGGSPDTRVRAARPADMPNLAVIERAAFAPRWRHSAETLLHILVQAASFAVAEWRGSVVGFQFSQAGDDRAHLVRLTVHPAAQKYGVGSRLLAAALESYATLGLSTVSLNTQADNFSSHRLYAAFGFRPIGPAVPVWERPV